LFDGVGDGFRHGCVGGSCDAGEHGEAVGAVVMLAAPEQSQHVNGLFQGCGTVVVDLRRNDGGDADGERCSVHANSWVDPAMRFPARLGRRVAAYPLQSRAARVAQRTAVLVPRPSISARIGVGIEAASWNMAAFRACAGCMPRSTSFWRIVPVERCRPGMAPGNSHRRVSAT
jgi:hypothetical protein